MVEIARYDGRPSEPHGGGGAYPDALTAGAEAMYDLGEPLVNAIARHGGELAVDVALNDPPVTSEQVLHPDSYLRVEQPRGVSLRGVGFWDPMTITAWERTRAVNSCSGATSMM